MASAARSIGDAPRSIDRPARRVMLGERHGSRATEGCARVLPRRARRLMSHQSYQCRVQIEVHAREMRLSPTLSEGRLWQALQGSRLGVGFRRQVVIDEYIVDFWRRRRGWWSRSMVAVTGGAVAPTRGASEFSSAPVSRAAPRGRGGHGQPGPRGGGHREAPWLRPQGEARSLRNAEVAGRAAAAQWELD
jgi:hypothetical protein